MDDPRVKYCQFCSAEMRRPPGLNSARRAGRRYCSRACSAAARGRTPPEKTCPGCGGTFRRRAGEQSSGFAARKYCGRRCRTLGAASAAWSPSELRPCERCGRPIPHAGGGARRYARRRFCSVGCASKKEGGRKAPPRPSSPPPRPAIPCAYARCGRLFVPRSSRSRYCSDACSCREKDRLEAEAAPVRIREPSAEYLAGVEARTAAVRADKERRLAQLAELSPPTWTPPVVRSEARA
jgi:hypothetical protein